ncbi:hypothetical protein LSH36_193g05024 [Paralvinella palmiformis]|uniref:Dihydrolipoamide acetyltransferase component of pyruvate dehydrogenase complex n=1 Tax=Paralvinella palmiformis TaxID=53620 RepID=A0AAD9N7V6_9ANNE|nr:hypothetical protein LSH36_193g05024 [Paralvinella palmiformis]
MLEYDAYLGHVKEPMPNGVGHHVIYKMAARFLDKDALKVKMPSLSPTMTEGTIVQWLKKEGDPLSAGDIICEIQTDKAVVGYEVDEDGILAKILKPENSKDVKIGTVIGLIVEEGEDWKNVEIPPDVEQSAPSDTGPVTPSSKESPAQSSLDQPDMHSIQSYGPAVRCLLEQYNIQLTDVHGTGPANRILKGDLLKYIKDKNLKPVPLASISLPKGAVASTEKTSSTSEPAVEKKPSIQQPTMGTEGANYVDIDLSNIRKVIARRLTESKISSPHMYCTIDSNIVRLIQLRKEFIDDGTKVSMNDFIIKAAAVALQKVPEVNSLWKENGISIMSNIDISVAVATDSGLITPIVKDAIGLGVEDISKMVKDLAGKAREGKLKPEEYQGGTFTISNLGMFGVSEFTAIINPPQACIMAIGTSRVELDEEGTPQTYMKVTLSADARIVDEFLATRFLEAFKEIIENPVLMLSQAPKIDHQKLFAK